MDYLLILLLITNFVALFLIRYVSKRAYVIGVVDTMVSYKGVVNVQVRRDSSGQHFYYDMANDVFLFQTKDRQEAIGRASKLFPEAKMIVFSTPEMIES